MELFAVQILYHCPNFVSIFDFIDFDFSLKKCRKHTATGVKCREEGNGNFACQTGITRSISFSEKLSKKFGGKVPETG